MVDTFGLVRAMSGSTLPHSLILGRVLRPWSHEPLGQMRDRGELDCGEETFRQLVVAGCDAAKSFDLVEEPLEEVALPIEEFAEADRVLAIGPGRNVGRGVASGDGGTKGVNGIHVELWVRSCTAASSPR